MLFVCFEVRRQGRYNTNLVCGGQPQAIPHEDASMLENVKDMQILPVAGFVCDCSVLCAIEIGFFVVCFFVFTFDFDLLRVQPYSYSLY